MTAWTPLLLALARRYVATEPAAEDVVQETWLTVLAKLPGFAGRSALRTWVCGILVHKARAAGVRDRRSVPFSSAWRDEHAPAVDPGRFHAGGPWAGGWAIPPYRWDLEPEERLGAAELGAVIDAAIAVLPRRQREVITVRDVLGMDAAEARTVLDLTDANQRVLLHRARSRVRAAVESYAGGGAVPAGGRRGRVRRDSRDVSCRRLVELVTDYLEGALRPSDRAAVEAHLAHCDPCDGYVAQVRRMLELTRDPELPAGRSRPEV